MSHDIQKETVQNLKEEVLTLNNDCTSVPVEDTTLNDPPLTKKNKQHPQEELLGTKFQDNCSSSSSSTVATSDELISSEISRYKVEKPAVFTENPLKWWKDRKSAYPNLSVIARKYWGIVATSVPLEHLFSIAGLVVTSKRASLDPSNVEKLVFLHDNLPFPHHLNYKWVKCSCEDCKNE